MNPQKARRTYSKILMVMMIPWEWDLWMTFVFFFMLFFPLKIFQQREAVWEASVLVRHIARSKLGLGR